MLPDLLAYATEPPLIDPDVILSTNITAARKNLMAFYAAGIAAYTSDRQTWANQIRQALHQDPAIILPLGRRSTVTVSIRPHRLKRSRPSPVMKGAVDRIALNHPSHPRPIHPSAKRQHLARLRMNHDVLFLNRSLHPARLIRPLEMPGNHRPVLFQVKILRRGRSIRILAI